MKNTKHAHKVMTTSKVMDRSTPPEFYAWLDGQMNFTVDVCADERNHKHPRYFDLSHNGLAQSWVGETFWCNPPYGRSTPQWFAKARDSAMAGAMGTMLVPARVGVDWWRRYVLQHDGEAGRLRDVRAEEKLALTWYRYQRLVVGVYFHDERLPFDGLDTGAPFDVAVIFYGKPGMRPALPRIDSSLTARREWPMLVERWP